MTIIIGIDPGSCQTGYGVVKQNGSDTHYVTSGHIPVAGKSVSARLQQIFLCLKDIVNLYQPDEAAVEQIFMHQNPNSALKLGQARGAAIVALGMNISEYTARQVKQSVVGFGAANKNQVAQMVMRLLNIKKKLQTDEADALAVALCHAQYRFCFGNLGLTRVGKRRTSWRNYKVPT